MDLWYNVKIEYSILLHPVVPLSKPIYASANADEWMVGTTFIVIKFVEVCLVQLYTILAF